MAHEGSRPTSRSAVAIIADVVVFPWAPATATKSRPRAARARACDRWRTFCERSRAAASSGLPSRMAEETTRTASAGTCRASCPIDTEIPSAAKRRVVWDSFESDPETAAPEAASSSATTLMPAPPIPTRWYFSCGVLRGASGEASLVLASFIASPPFLR